MTEPLGPINGLVPIEWSGWGGSSVGQSRGLIILGSWVQAPPALHEAPGITRISGAILARDRLQPGRRYINPLETPSRRCHLETRTGFPFSCAGSPWNHRADRRRIGHGYDGHRHHHHGGARVDPTTARHRLGGRPRPGLGPATCRVHLDRARSPDTRGSSRPRSLGARSSTGWCHLRDSSCHATLCTQVRNSLCAHWV